MLLLKQQKRTLLILNPRVILVLQETKVGTIHTNVVTIGRITKQTRCRRDQLGRQSAKDSSRKEKVELRIIHHDQPKASSHTNDNYCGDKLQVLAGSQTLTQRQTMNTYVNSCCKSCSYCAWAFAKERNKSRVSRLLLSKYYYQKGYRLKYVKGVSCVTQLSCVKPATNVKNAASNLPVGATLPNYWQTWLNLGAGPKVVQIVRDGYTLPFRIQPNLTRSPTVIKLLCQSPQEPLPGGGITSAYRQKRSRAGTKSKTSGVFQPIISSA